MFGFEKKGIWTEASLTVWGFIVFFLSNFKIIIFGFQQDDSSGLCYKTFSSRILYLRAWLPFVRVEPRKGHDMKCLGWRRKEYDLRPV